MALNVMQEMRVWLLLGGVKNGPVHSFFVTDMGWINLNVPFMRNWTDDGLSWLSDEPAPDALQELQVHRLSVIVNIIQ